MCLKVVCPVDAHLKEILDHPEMKNSNMRMKKISVKQRIDKCLLAIEAVVRLGSATLAANELFVTQTAISHRIRELERQMNLDLFVRNGRRLEPTAAALCLAEAVRECDKTLQIACSTIESWGRESGLTISMLPSVASKWLAPHMAEAAKAFPDVDLKVSSSREISDFQSSGVNVSIRYGLGNWLNARAKHLTDEYVVLVMSPDIAKRIDFECADALCGQTFLCSDNPDTWENWFRSSPYCQPEEANKIVFDDDAAMIEAAIAGHGIALGRSVLIYHDLRCGRLVNPLGAKMKAKYSYWFVQLVNEPETKPRQEMFKWLQKRIHEAAEYDHTGPRQKVNCRA
ncbi:MAG: LysR family transcriptional regulator [Rhodobacteraceae bacterium]|nr:LysR family transcriptional regulator [Paracoccaceae bacterium]